MMAKFDLKDLKLDEVIDDLRSGASKRFDDMVGEGRSQARRAGGGHEDGPMFSVFTLGLLAGALVGAAVALLMTPVSGTDARRKLSDQVDKVRSGMGTPEWEKTSGNGTPVSSSYSSPTMGQPGQ
ncbi:MAG: hypothetical protein NVSMB8_00130 [Candidatus Limnocylindrales bacterium]